MSNEFFDDDDEEQLISKEKTSLFQTKTDVMDHKLDEFFDVDPGQTELVKAELIFKELVKHQHYDDKDDEVERDIYNVYKLALEAFQDTQTVAQTFDPKYEVSARETAATFLNTALNAAQAKANFKSTKDKTVIAEQRSSLKENGDGETISMRQSDLIRLLRGTPPESVDGEFEEIKE